MYSYRLVPSVSSIVSSGTVRFMNRIFPSRSAFMMKSGEASNMARNLSSLSRSASSANLRSVMLIKEPMIHRGLSSSLVTRLIAISAVNVEQSALLAANSPLAPPFFNVASHTAVACCSRSQSSLKRLPVISPALAYPHISRNELFT